MSPAAHFRIAEVPHARIQGSNVCDQRKLADAFEYSIVYFVDQLLCEGQTSGLFHL